MSDEAIETLGDAVAHLNAVLDGHGGPVSPNAQFLVREASKEIAQAIGLQRAASSPIATLGAAIEAMSPAPHLLARIAELEAVAAAVIEAVHISLGGPHHARGVWMSNRGGARDHAALFDKLRSVLAKNTSKEGS